MKIKYIRYLTLLFLTVWTLPVAADLQHTVTFDRNKLVIGEQEAEDGTVYTTVRYDDLSTTVEEGNPELPVHTLHLLVPTEVTNFSITINSSETENMALTHSVYPVQTPVPTSIESTDYPFVVPNQLIYKSSSAYPLATVSIDRDGFFDGNNHILTLSVSPVRYFPIENRLEFIKTLSFTVHYGAATRSMDNRLQAIYKETSGDTKTLERLQKIVDNKDAVNSLIKASQLQTQPLVKTAGSVSTIPCYEYCVITTRNLAPAFKRLIGWKRMKGLDAGVVTIEQIKADPYITGDLNSNIFDDAGKIRQYLTAAYVKGTKYVLFGGDYSILPIRYGLGGNSIQDPYYNIPSDLYFSDLNSNWNTDNSDYYGKKSDNLDYWPELYVGRILCTKTEEVERYANKLIRYEMNPGNNNFSYIKNAFYQQSDEMQRYQDAQEISVIFNSIFNKQTIYEELPGEDAQTPTFPTGKQVIDEINTGYGYISIHGHGSPNGIAVSTSGINGWPYRSHIVSHKGYLGETGNSWENLSNSLHPAVLYSMSCTNMPFDDFETTKINLGESYTVGGDYGGPAFLGNTRYGWIPSSQYLYKEFAQVVADGEHCLGIAEALSKAKYVYHYLSLAHNLLGCPEFKMWTNVPVKTEPITVQRNISSVRLTNPNHYTAYIRGLFGDDDYYLKTQNNGLIYLKKALKGYSLIITRPDGFPYIPPMSVQNVNITGTYYIFGSSVTMGRNVGYSTEQGDVVIKNGADLTLELTDEITLDYGVEIEPGASFEVKRPVVM